MNRWRFRPQIVAATFFPLIVFALLAATVSGYALVEIPRQILLERQTALAKAAAAGVAADIRGYTRLLESVAGELADNAGQLPRQQAIMIDRTRLLGRFTAGSTLLDARGTAVALTPDQDASLGLNYAFRQYFQQVRATLGPIYTTVIRDQPEGFPAVVIAVPVLSVGTTPGHATDFSGVLLGEFALDKPEWAEELGLASTGAGSSVYLLDAEGTIIYHPDRTRIGSSIRDDPPVWAFAQAGAAGSRVVTLPDASHRIISLAPIEGIPWLLASEESWEQVTAPLVHYRWAAGGLLALGMLTALLLLWMSLTRVTRPLTALLEQGRRVTEGATFVPVPKSGPRDVQELIDAINRMVVRLADQGRALRGYAAQVVRSQEQERLRLARDLHDETVQQLVGLAQRLELARIQTSESDQLRSQLIELQQLAYATADEVRRMSNRLRPAILEDLGLAKALAALSRTVAGELPQSQVSFEIVGRERRLPAEMELTVFRIAQEALTNVRKHAHTALHIDVALYYEEWGIVLLVEDDGPGWSEVDAEELIRRGHLGVAGIMERALLFGGEARFSGGPEDGTTLRLTLPTRENGTVGLLA